MNEIFVGWILGLIPLILGFLIGWFAGRGSLQDKVKEIIRYRNKDESTGIVRPLSPLELSKKKAREIYKQYM